MDKQIVVYADRGVDGAGLRQTIRGLQAVVDQTQHRIVRMDAQEIKEKAWEDETALIVFPGGRDIFYHAALSGEGTKKIREFVHSGGSYLGLCAGGYFGARAIEFEKGGKIEVCAERELGFFPGIAKGPALGLNKYSYECYRGAEAARISWEGGECRVYYNGGCFFDPYSDLSACEVVGRFAALPDMPIAIVRCRVGRGQAILSGVHLEYNADLLPQEDIYLQEIIPALQKEAQEKNRLFREILSSLKIQTAFQNVPSSV